MSARALASPRFILLALALALAASLSASARPRPRHMTAPDALPPPQLLLWSSSATREEAEAQLAQLKASGGGWEDFYALAKTFPRVLESKTVEGLKPGAFVVALGVCPTEEETTGLVDALKAFAPSLSTRPVTWNETEAACPMRTGSWVVTHVQRWKSGGRELTAVELGQGGDWRLLMFLRDRAGNVLDSDDTDAEESGPLQRVGACDESAVSYSSSGPVLAFSCDVVGKCGPRAHERYRIRYRIQGEKILSATVDRKVTQGACD